MSGKVIIGVFQLGRVIWPGHAFDGCLLWFAATRPSEEERALPIPTSVVDVLRPDRSLCVPPERVEHLACFAAQDEVEVFVTPDALPRYLNAARRGETLIPGRPVGGPLPWSEIEPLAGDPNPELN